MQYEVRSDGKRMFPAELKRQILNEIEAGGSPSQVARQHGVPVHYVIRWRRVERQSHEKALIQAGAQAGKPEETVPLSEYRKMTQENQQLRKSLANMTMDRDILKDAVEIASKKKWI